MENDIIKKIELLKKYQSETNQIEAKTASKDFPKKCYDTISSFSNTYGGTIIFGIDEENGFTEHDVYDIKDLQSKISSLCADAMEPIIRPEFEMIEYNGKKLLAVNISELPQTQKPCYYKPAGMLKGSFIRIGDNDEHMTDYEIYSLQSYKNGVQEDLRPVKRATIDDLNKEKINEYLRIVRDSKPHFAKNSDEKILKLCGVLESDQGNMYPTLAGILLFADYPQAFFPQLFIACVSFPGNEVGELGELGQRFDDNKRVEGTIEEMLEGTLTFLRKNMKNRVIIDQNTGKRTNLSEYPMLVLKEAVANALVHRDYSVSREGTYIQVHMFKDRIVVQNPGALYGNNKLDKQGTDTIMEARNKNIIRILEEKGSIIENRHTGIPTMKNEMKKNKLPEPIFEEIRGDFKVTFKNDSMDIDQGVDQGKNKMNINKNILEFCKIPRTAKEIAINFGYSSHKYFKRKYIKPLLLSGNLKMTIPEKPSSENQKYVDVNY